MRCRINLESDPISLIILSADGFEHGKLDCVGHDGIVEVGIGGIIERTRSEKPKVDMPNAGGQAHPVSPGTRGSQSDS